MLHPAGGPKMFEGVFKPASPSPEAADHLASLSAKQRDVLDLLIKHKTSKEISRILGISPHTVDQRILLARGKLGVQSRGDLADAYRHLLQKSVISGACEKSVYGSKALVPTQVKYQSLVTEDADTVQSPRYQTEVIALVPRTPQQAVQDYSGHRVLSEWFDGRFGTLVRLGMVLALTAVLIVVGLGGLALFAALSRLLDS